MIGFFIILTVCVYASNFDLLVIGNRQDPMNAKLEKKLRLRFPRVVAEYISWEDFEETGSFRHLALDAGLWRAGSDEDWLDSNLGDHSECTNRIVLGRGAPSDKMLEVLARHRVNAYVSAHLHRSEMGSISDYPTKFLIAGASGDTDREGQGIESPEFSHLKRKTFLQIKCKNGEWEYTFHPANSVGGDPIYKSHIGGELVQATQMTVNLDRLEFVAFGDWGTPGEELDLFTRGHRALTNPAAVWLLGDNFYPLGISSLEDPRFEDFTALKSNFDPNWKYPYLNGIVSLFSALILDIITYWQLDEFYDVDDDSVRSENSDLKFYTILGNHDYAGDVDAQIEYSTVDPQWVMPSRFYFTRFEDGDAVVCTWFLDTDSDRFNAHQAAWMDQSVQANIETCTWLVAVGHHHVYSGGDYARNERLIALLVPILAKYQFHMYISGHEHQSQVLRNPEMLTLFLIAGASSELNAPEEAQDEPFLEFINYKIGAWLHLQFTKESAVIKFQARNSFILWETLLSRH